MRQNILESKGAFDNLLAQIEASGAGLSVGELETLRTRIGEMIAQKAVSTEAPEVPLSAPSKEKADASQEKIDGSVYIQRLMQETTSPVFRTFLETLMADLSENKLAQNVEVGLGELVTSINDVSPEQIESDRDTKKGFADSLGKFSETFLLYANERYLGPIKTTEAKNRERDNLYEVSVYLTQGINDLLKERDIKIKVASPAPGSSFSRLFMRSVTKGGAPTLTVMDVRSWIVMSQYPEDTESELQGLLVPGQVETS